jgi:hypothetical protein
VLDIDDVPLIWRQRALDALSAEAWAEDEAMKHAQAAARAKG